MTLTHERRGMLRSKDGIGLVEILVAMAILGLGITMVMRTLPDSNTATTRARNVSKATNLAQEKLERLMDTPYTDADLASGDHKDPDNPIEGAFTRTWTVQDDTPYTDMKRILVTVGYPTANPDSTVTIDSIISARW
jgi:type II secretory pathway pseudopilin PulG